VVRMLLETALQRRVWVEVDLLGLNIVFYK
jgi:hypothetical protein